MKSKKEIIISIIIPMYNGEKFINNSMHSIINDLSLNSNVLKIIEIIIINDGSKDDSLNLARNWESEWNEKIRNNFIKVIDKENGQYGSVINKALEIARGRYVKVLDVDDIFDTKCLIEIIQIISGIRLGVDVILTDFIFDKVLNNKQLIYRWNKYFEPYKILRMGDVNYPNSIITMHSLIYRTNFLKEIGYKQLEGVYYSDSQYALIPFSLAKTLYYINIPLYRYYIGRNDQSINIKTMVKNRMDQRKVMNKIFEELFEIETNSAAQKKYAWRVAKNMFEWQSMIISHDTNIPNRGKQIYNDLVNLMNECKKKDLYGYRVIKKGILSRIIKLTRGKGIVAIIKFGQRLYAKFKLNIMADWD